jgi:hypothetical protein
LWNSSGKRSPVSSRGRRCELLTEKLRSLMLSSMAFWRSTFSEDRIMSIGVRESA